MSKKPYDIFISYAIEDKMEIAHDLYLRLQEKGLNVWYAGKELRVGDSLEDSIQDGIAKSRYGIILITQNYLRKNWTRKELYSLIAREDSGEKVILPIFHDISYEEVAKIDLRLADRWALSTKNGIGSVVNQITREVLSEVVPTTSTKKRKTIWVPMVISLILLTAVCLYFIYSPKSPPNHFVEKAINQRLESFEAKIETEWELLERDSNYSPVNENNAMSFYQHWQTLNAQYRNTYEFDNGIERIQFQKNVEPATGIDFDIFSPVNNYGLKQPQIMLSATSEESEYVESKLVYRNSQMVNFNIIKTEREEEDYQVIVRYENIIRLLNISYTYSERSNYRKHTGYRIKGLKKIETFIFRDGDMGWTLSEVK